ncbi:MAG: GNAT family N-acetyltransferase [Candidatus Dormibacteraeota bacterium]|nr:GNAT family N-acetyltransferase [Candidatus Dormibacteraeota bacterium]
MRFFRHSGVRVTLAEAGDAPALADLYERAWDGCEGLISEHAVAVARPSAEDLAAWLEGGFEIYRVAADARLVGAVRCSFPTSTCLLDSLAVDPDSRRRGIGRSLVDHVIARARRAGVARVWTAVNPGLVEFAGLFAEAGFRETTRLGSDEDRAVILLELPV